MPEQICDFTVTIEPDGPYLNTEIILHDPTDECRRNARYYFYLVKDGAVIDRKGWYVENYYRWIIAEPGRYFVQGYVSIGDERTVRKSVVYVCADVPETDSVPEPFPPRPIGVSIFGSCTTRDLFRLFPPRDLELKTYIARQSVVSAVSAPVPLEMEQIKLDSAFQRTAVWRDFNKSSFDLLRGDGSEWLIIDLIDERFALSRIGYSYVTKSTMAVEAGVVSADMKESERVWVGDDFVIDGIRLKSYVTRFAKKLLEIYQPDHIVIHRAMTVDRYWDARGELRHYSESERNAGQTVNRLMACMYDQLQECIPEAKVIDRMSGYYGSETHGWGLANVHYEDGYYDEVMREIVALIRPDKWR